ncbi:hypothetical protein Ksed_06420 [Kytococcus sedentarius DSM 20547]|uniref:Uncharacterized protein n=1 Tax=Kytococcus sedentarius (strain ATCC 14392 / DSM 20547 / JCM 11482 / CCUG 33030 / NBRC 15357 / NCTC 11040 / CCM 314 / 541) TaxID=478801 RepID=C7NLN8_KYTSD|nr:hypothetical protein Ksed_06420 [Kytococcus sedentarius DSM 20547]
MGRKPECVRGLNDASEFCALSIGQLSVTQDQFALLRSFEQLGDKPVAFIVIH